VSFFEGRRAAVNAHDDDEEIDEIEDLDEPRSAYLGGVVAVEAVIARSETAAVAVRGIVAYPDGFEFRLVLWVRRPHNRGRRRLHPMWEPIMLEPLGLDPGGELPAEFLRFGIQFPDGASVTNLDSPPWELSPDATAPSHGIAETRYEVNADDIRRAAERALPVWPDLLGPSHVTRSQIMPHMTASHIRATENPRGDH
jgi:hypothetical protein